MNTKKMLAKHFDIKDMGVTNVMLRLKISRTYDGIVFEVSLV